MGNGLIVLLVEKKCLDDVKYLQYCFRVCFSISKDFKLLEIFPTNMLPHPVY